MVQGDDTMDMNCNECQAIAAEMRVALVDLIKRPTGPAASRPDLHNFLNKLFSSEVEIARLADAFRDTRLGQGYARWTEHRIATGHTGARVSWSMN
jgi:hypothetical protein